MKALTFRGGVHPWDGKELSMNQPIRELKAGPELAFLLSQHIGAPAKPIVAKGDRVLKGMKIAEAGGFVSAPVYSSVSGTVKGIDKRRNALGDMADAIIVENDGLYEAVPAAARGDVASLSKEEIVGYIREAGIVGMGGAGFPTHVKLSPKDPDAIEYVLVNGAECEPYLTSDYRIMLEQPKALLSGLSAMLRLFDRAEGVVCIEDNKPEAIRIMTEAAAGMDRIRVQVLKTKYPEGAERSLIKAVTGRELNSRMLPADVGCIVDNVDTVLAIHNAVINGLPLTTRVFTISGDAVSTPGNYDVPIGMYYSEIIEEAGGFKSQPEKIISGGPMMGFAVFSTDIPVTKTSGALLGFLNDEVRKAEETSCINCGRCLRGCPQRLMPCRLADFAEHSDKEAFRSEYGLECVECGCCSYQCPAKRPLAQEIKAIKRTIMADMRKAK